MIRKTNANAHVIVVTLATLLAATAACRVLVGVEEDPPTRLGPVDNDAGGGGDVGVVDSSLPSTDDATPKKNGCGLVGLNGTCASCVETSCCAEAQACAANASCLTLANCLAGCPATSNDNTACRTACRGVNTPFSQEAAALATCQASKCESACEVECGGYVYDDATCGACGVTKVCAQSKACMNSPACAGLVACEQSCKSDAACIAHCELLFPTGIALQRKFGSDLNAACAETCIAPRWQCLKNPPLPSTATGAKLDVTYRLFEFKAAESSRAAGLSVQPCVFGAPHCTYKQSNVISNTSGEATLPFQNQFTDYVEITGGTHAPVLVFLPRLTTDLVTDIGVVDELTLFGLAALAGVELQPDRGNVIVRVLDCFDNPADGVELALGTPDSAATRFYFDENSNPSTTATETAIDERTGSYGGFLNVAAGPLLPIRATVKQNHLSFKEATFFAVKATVDGVFGYTLVTLYAKPPK